MGKTLERMLDYVLNQSDLNWSTVILPQAYRALDRCREVIDLLQHRVAALLDSKAEAEFVTSDFRILLCEALFDSIFPATARFYHSLGNWQEALKTWNYVLGYGHVDQEATPSGSYDRQYDVVVSVYSLGVAYVRTGDKEKTRQIVEITESEPKRLKGRNKESDYAH
ncbi:hypothetical protein BDY21DRAFT_420576 [Lineolata rhizophorae]|uniref:Uncharacterized protein n=1 Tax=Lineolata rhizophorae TaxID=578093 RepID=A0A6A6P3X9_9PEZI|nr:hypothetical protein BDY21DRAFT_420576 [Lineolata rhizophorae]